MVEGGNISLKSCGWTEHRDQISSSTCVANAVEYPNDIMA